MWISIKLFALIILPLVNCQDCTEVCYEEVECFDDCFPWEEFPLPKNPEYIRTDFVEASGAFDSSRSATYYLIHGFSHHANTSWMQAVKDALLDHGDYNVYLVDWRIGALPDPEAPIAPIPASNTRVVGRIVRNHIQDLQAQGLNLADVHCIGHSLGAHACGFLGKEFTSPQIGRISGLDPAGMIYTTCPDGNVCRLNGGDAALVDAIHTNPWGTATVSGIPINCADVDVWPNGGDRQPGCGNDLTGICSHERATELFEESINTACTAYTCDSFEDMQQDDCHDNCDSAACQLMGFQTTNSPRGTFRMNTNGDEPFCQD